MQAGFTEAGHLDSVSLCLEGAFMAVTDQARTVVGVFSGEERAGNAMDELLKLGIPRNRIDLISANSGCALKSDLVETYSEEIRQGAVLVAVTANSEDEANEVRDLLDRHDVPDLGQVTGQAAGAERLSADEKLRQGEVVDQGDSMQASRRTRIIPE
jgi:hypothetical protein